METLLPTLGVSKLIWLVVAVGAVAVVLLVFGVLRKNAKLITGIVIFAGFVTGIWWLLKRIVSSFQKEKGGLMDTVPTVPVEKTTMLLIAGIALAAILVMIVYRRWRNRQKSQETTAQPEYAQQTEEVVKSSALRTWEHYWEKKRIRRVQNRVLTLLMWLLSMGVLYIVFPDTWDAWYSHQRVFWVSQIAFLAVLLAFGQATLVVALFTLLVVGTAILAVMNSVEPPWPDPQTWEEGNSQAPQAKDGTQRRERQAKEEFDPTKWEWKLCEYMDPFHEFEVRRYADPKCFGITEFEKYQPNKEVFEFRTRFHYQGWQTFTCESSEWKPSKAIDNGNGGCFNTYYQRKYVITDLHKETKGEKTFFWGNYRNPEEGKRGFTLYRQHASH